MATSYPGGLDSFTNPGPTDFTADEIGGRTLDEFIADHNDAIEAMQTNQYPVNTVAASGATETLPITHAAYKVTMDEACTFTFTSPTAGHSFLLWLLGAFTPVFPGSVDWDSATPPTYVNDSLYAFTTLDAGTTWLGSLVASGLA